MSRLITLFLSKKSRFFNYWQSGLNYMGSDFDNFDNFGVRPYPEIKIQNLILALLPKRLAKPDANSYGFDVGKT
jgi:hypothetical protein